MAKMCENGGMGDKRARDARPYAFHRLRERLPPLRLLLPPLRRSPSLEEGGLWGGKSRVGRMSAGARCAPLRLPPLENSFHRLRAVPLPRRGRSWGEGNRELAECRRARDARPYNVAENCNCEMRLQRWVASLQRLDAFATVGCTAVLCRGRASRARLSPML